MTLKIDSAGRVIIPKPVRDRLGLHADSDLDLQETPDGYDILRAIETDREERDRKARGL